MATSRRNKAVALLATASVASIALAACGGAADKAADKPAESGEAITIEYLHRLPDGEGMVKVEEIAKRWNDEHPNVQVKTTKFDGKSADMFLKLENDVKAGTAPCLAQLGYGEIPEAFVKGMVEDVTAEAEKYKENFSGAYGQMSVGGTVVGLPQDTGPLVYYYDEAEFKALGIEVPKTIDELKAAAKKAAEQGKFIIGFEPDEAGYWLSAQAAAVGDAWYSAADGKWKVNTVNRGAEVVASFWQEMLDSKAAFVSGRWAPEYEKALQDKKLVGNIGPAWEAGFFLDNVVPADKEGTWKVALLPDFGEGVKTGPDGGSGVAVMKGCAHVAEAMEFNNWFNTQTKDLATQGLIVAAKGEVVTPEKAKRQFGGQDVWAELAKANETLNPDFNYIPGYSAVVAQMTAKAEAAAKGEAKVIDIFKAAQDESVKVLKDLKLPVAE
ncbi:ABC transporter, solute-binding protein [Gleimia coleocanis DSM 15436]|uniref:ABC transporter, solute-binding protein n=1 Tax=Gleimia coleocanis DSM 15436 TaxID=525245 RepID=C0W274_9ACTO|nr:extracellular solute-binding protein [Gleimia coleocanis]EEH63288.1 ABC transporter, solute-binding protein [Gleimia coleocanis DSM 15436]